MVENKKIKTTKAEEIKALNILGKNGWKAWHRTVSVFGHGIDDEVCLWLSRTKNNNT